MAAPDSERFRRRLLARQAELMAVAGTAAEAADTVELDQTRVGRLSRMDALQQQAMSQENQRRRALELRRIVQALSRIKDQTYGYCVECDEEIAENRLEIDPAAPLCIRCASEQEKPRD
ncbi:TraR/DksA family transcriptional regulator [Sedimenticola sp.]|uniref:TraR/DksA family transcriptional regulator n=1 Tax=Sedimenticola sp. TaxID=1940285 RepID=UPI003D09AABB